jgi:hypothetical protein
MPNRPYRSTLTSLLDFHPIVTIVFGVTICRLIWQWMWIILGLVFQSFDILPSDVILYTPHWMTYLAALNIVLTIYLFIRNMRAEARYAAILAGICTAHTALISWLHPDWWDHF